ncbi:MAG: hypothetical protein SV966_05885 [Actinomycetota bacterium]|nr:hypothetical protein [Actinomycetota bacterium]
MMSRVPAALLFTEQPTLTTGDLAARLQASDDVWAVFRRGRGITVSPTGSAARTRLLEMRDFYAFLLDEMPAVLDRWRAHRSNASVAEKL